ncbi:hypothetical protein [Streptomyces chryseus]|uniref:Secreted protein n=1 Tax=Streptomyces chryseus TaxID=68186 RepID=A0ABQ3DKF8_9ACTN|nr:hypothetical protein [Streptomyces chryseus]GHA96057.1 hypothetical protein GCM10010346_18420 [Streptomyces chryseus]
MTDSALWISALTAGTAVLASWVTSRGTARAAQIQAVAAEKTQRTIRINEARRNAYVSLIEQAHRMAELYWTVSDTHRAGGTRSEQLPALKEVQAGLREGYGKLRHFIWVINLEGPDDVAEAAETLRLATRPPYQALEAAIAGEPDALDAFDQCYDPFWASVLAFVSTARAAVHDL